MLMLMLMLMPMLAYLSGLAVVVVLVCDVHDGGDHVRPRLVLLPIEFGTVEWRGRGEVKGRKGKGREEKRAEVEEKMVHKKT
jgi:hypothetical protein